MSDSQPTAGVSNSVGTFAPNVTIARSGSGVFAFLRYVFSFPVMLGTLLVLFVFATACQFIVDPDLWWHVKVGEMILTTHHWPTVDPFSFTVAGQPWLAYEWGGDVLLASVSRLAGLRGLDALLIVLSGGVLIALYCLTTLCARNSKAGFVAAAILLVLGVPSFSLRPQMLGYLFLILTLIVLERFRRGKRGGLWLLPLLFLVWVNTHASWIIGLGTLATYWLCGLFEFRLGRLEAYRWSLPDRLRISFVFLLSLCALPFTPYGTQLCAYPFDVASSLPVNVANILEWQPMPFNMVGGKIFLGLLLAFLLAQITFRFTWRLETLVLFLFGATMATLHVRFLLLFVPFFAPLLAMVLVRWIPPYERGKDQPLLNAALIAASVLVMVHYFPTRANLESTVAESFPVGAVSYLNQHDVPGPMFNTYGFGGYLVWSRGPEHKVFIDGRGELYEHSGLLYDYIQVLDIRPSAFAVLRVYGIQSCILNRAEPLATILNALPEWQKVYSDNLSVIFVRRVPAAPVAMSKISAAGQE